MGSKLFLSSIKGDNLKVNYSKGLRGTPCQL